MNKIIEKFGIGVLTVGLNTSVFAGITIGDSQTAAGALNISGTLRANYQDKEYGESVSDQKLKFDAAILHLQYESPNWFGKAEYRCYQYDTLCDFSTLVYAYAGYRLNSTDNITLGLQPIPFGPGRFWDSSFYASINNTMGLQDIHNLGVKYHVELPSSTQLDLSYFAMDGGHYHGDSRDSARYTANVVKSADPSKTSLQEKNMWIGRISQDLNFLDIQDLKVSVGGSYWYSDIENHKNNGDGSRKAWALFNNIHYKNLAIVLTGGELSINNKDSLNTYYSTFGSFDSEYDLANKGYFYTIDTRYTFEHVWEDINLTPYFVYSGYDKKEKSFDDSERHIVGVAMDYKNISLYTEYVMSKNDPFIGGTGSSLAAGDDGKRNKLLNIMLVYNF
ncbi:hypothetical protein [Acinetobacter puyangensis]|uniref:hypothetical protein n=1 Tax=Acinetobacter puyangensis TaxID=1096779 RepID=UPI003A4DBD6A